MRITKTLYIARAKTGIKKCLSKDILNCLYQGLAVDDYRVIMESSNVELSSRYVEMGLGISFATVVKDLPELEKRKLEFLPMDHLFKSDYIVVAMRKDKTLTSYKNAFIEILLGEALSNTFAFN